MTAAAEGRVLPPGPSPGRLAGTRLQLDEVVPALRAMREMRPAWPRPERMVLRGTIRVPHRSGLVTLRTRWSP